MDPSQPQLPSENMVISVVKKRVNRKKPANTQANADTVQHEANTDTVQHEANADTVQHEANADAVQHEANADAVQHEANTDTVPDADVMNLTLSLIPTHHKKRGRKPKGGKVIQQLVHEVVSINDAPNIILHLKCSVSDIPNLNAAFEEEASIKPGDVVSFNALESKGADLNDSYKSNMNSTGNFIISSSNPNALIANNSYNHLNDADYENNDDDNINGGDNNLKEIWKKLNHLKLCFHKSDVFQNIGAGTRRSCCFWDTCEFDTPPIYIPKCVAPNGGYTVYGCFCSPECALAYLMNEGIDTSVKFERCQMLNSMYGRALNYEKSIKPAPNPQYILNKFYGNLSIQEYRKLFKSEQIIYVVNKPLTHILPEMYEDNNDFLLNNKVIPNNNYKLKKKTSAFG
jgi:hypothetical protein